jgi:putative polyhydroxyalkanoate system protein
MPSIDIRRKHSMSMKDAKAAVDRTAEAIGTKFDIKSRWDGDTLHFTRSGVDGRIAVAKQEVHIQAELGFLLGFLKPQIEAEISRKLDEQFR